MKNLVCDFMSPFPLTIGEEQSLERAATLMNEARIHHLPVLHGGKLVGLLSSRDIDFLRSVPGICFKDLTVEQAMSQSVVTVLDNDSMVDVLAVMVEKKIGSVVVAKNSRPIGIFTATDALKLLLEYEKSLEAVA